MIYAKIQMRPGKEALRVCKSPDCEAQSAVKGVTHFRNRIFPESEDIYVAND